MKLSKIAAIGAVSVASSAWAQNLVLNGGFESAIDMANCNWVDLHAPSSGLPSWQVTTGSIDHVRYEETCPNLVFPAIAPEGTHLIDLDGVLSAGSISQSVTLVPGAAYELRFLMSGNDYCGPSVKRLRVNIDGISRDFSYTCGPIAPHPFVLKNLVFQAHSTSSTLSFTSLDGSGCGPLIDRVELSPRNLISNGGFETGLEMANCSWIDLHAPSSQLPSWQVTGGSIDHVRYTKSCDLEPFRAFAPEGIHLLDLDGVLSAGSISQAVALEPGAVYGLRFLMSGNNYCGPSIKRLRVTIDGVSSDFAYTCGASAPNPFVLKALVFQAQSANATLAFLSLDGSGCGPLIDRVELIKKPACTGDVNEDGIVDGTDLGAVLAGWGTAGAGYPWTDVNDDGVVGAADLTLVLSGWGVCP